MIAEVMNDIGFPVGGAVFKVGGVERCFLVGVVGIIGAELGEGCGCRESGYGFCEEADFVARVLLQQRREIGRGVVAYRGRALHHELCLSEDFATGVADEEGVRKLGDEKSPCADDDDQDEVELGEQFHCLLRFHARRGI